MNIHGPEQSLSALRNQEMSETRRFFTSPETTNVKLLWSCEPQLVFIFLGGFLTLQCKCCSFHIYCWKIPLKMPERAWLAERRDLCWMNMWAQTSSAGWKTSDWACLVPRISSLGCASLLGQTECWTWSLRSFVSVLAVCLGAHYWTILCLSDPIF